MAVDIGSKTVNGQERTSRATRLTPADGNYRLVVAREEVFRDANGNVIGQRSVAGIDLTIASILASPSAATMAYLAACKAANTLQDLLAAEAAWYDALAAEAKVP